MEFRPQLVQQAFILLHDLFTGSGSARRGCNDFGQRCQALKRLGVFRPEALRPIGQLLHPMLYADRQLFPAYRTKPLPRRGFRRRQAHAAVPVSVQMVFPFLRKKFHGPQEPLARPDCMRQRGIRKRGFQQIGFAPQLGGGMRVRMGNKRQPVQLGNAPIHRRIG